MQALRMSEKPEALRLANSLAAHSLSRHGQTQAAAELRRLSAVEAQRDALLKALKAAEPYLRHVDVDYNVYVQCRAALAQEHAESVK